MLALHRAILTDLGFEAGLASDGQEALEFLRENGPVALIVTDMNMPVMDGMELVEQLRQNPDHAQTPIVMVTTEKEASQKNLAETAGVSAFITKPFRPEQLKAMIALPARPLVPRLPYFPEEAGYAPRKGADGISAPHDSRRCSNALRATQAYGYADTAPA